PSLRDTSSRKREEGLTAVFLKILPLCKMCRYLWSSGVIVGFCRCRDLSNLPPYWGRTLLCFAQSQVLSRLAG
ncbi:hypothetical protein, partial [uncultured Cardiobacterium sp.]|uniref:hypothetical protein n=1 Tax=uncultured Cardiobacterium sp. TaxID=417619 RepID=UPI00262E1466